ncbi:MAG: DUF3526 domain-containing protein [Chitinophagaceae bacterium]|nr:DUF3526 domain-containing protein [Chitinophagaceae bacterium]
MQYGKKYRSLISLHAKLLFKNKINIVLIAAFVLAGLYGLYQGFAFKQKQVHTINRLVSEKDSIVQNLKSGFKADTLTEEGKTAYEAAKDIFTVSWKIDLPVYKYPASAAVYNIGPLTGGLIWICVCMLLPIIVSKTAEISTPVDNNIISTYSRRPQNPKIETDNQFAKSLIMAFAQQQPVYHFADTAITDPAFQFRVYHAYHYLLHNERWPLVQQYFANVESRQQITNISTLINPAGSTDGLLANIAGNDAAANHLFINQALRFHGKLQNVLYPSLFLNKEIQEADYIKLPVFSYHQNIPSKIIFLHFLLLIFITIVIFLAANRRLTRINH